MFIFLLFFLIITSALILKSQLFQHLNELIFSTMNGKELFSDRVNHVNRNISHKNPKISYKKLKLS